MRKNQPFPISVWSWRGCCFSCHNNVSFAKRCTERVLSLNPC